MNATTECAETKQPLDAPESLSREQLYELVWSTPLSHLAKKFHLSNVGLAKVCKKHRIPRPGVGHWARVKWGQSPDQTPLPDCEDEGLQRINFHPLREAEKPQPKPRLSDPELALRIAKEEEPAYLIVVPERVNSFHPLLQGLKQPTQKERGYDRHPTNHYTSFFRVSREQFDRGRRLLSTLFKAAEARGFRLSVSDNRWKSDAIVTVLDATFYLSLREPAKRHSVSEGERRSSFERYRYTPSGKLELHCGDSDRAHNPKVWRDLKKKPLEDRLNEIVISWLEGVERQRNDRAERERWEAEYLEKQRRRQEEAFRQQCDQERMNHLHELHNAWRDAKSLRTFLQEIEEHLAATDALSVDTAWGEWLAWARDYSERLDPLSGNRALLEKAVQPPPEVFRCRPR